MDTKRELRRGARGVWLGVLVASSLIVVALAAPVVANDDGTTSHLWNDHIKPMKQPGTINTATNPVDWTKLKGVPAGLADGIDDGVEGAGFGLNKVGTQFEIDSTEVQRRAVGGCGPGRAIREIVQDGSIDCDPVSQGLFHTDAFTDELCTNLCTLGTLNLAQGTWAISAKVSVQQQFDDTLWVECRLTSGDDSDIAHVRIPGVVGGPSTTLSMQLVTTLGSERGVNATVRCRDFGQGYVSGRDLSIMAIRVGG